MLAVLLSSLLCLGVRVASRRPLDSILAPLHHYQQQTKRGEQFELQLKFRDGLRAHNSSASESINVLRQANLSESVTVEALLSEYDLNLKAVLNRAEKLSGKQQPDLFSIMRLKFGRSPSIDVLYKAAQILDRVNAIEYVHLAPLIPPPPVMLNKGNRFHLQCEEQQASRPDVSPLFVSRQSYRGPDPGFDADYAKSVGATGRGVRLSDCEYSWHFEHEDLAPIGQEKGFAADPEYFPDHGTASLGVSIGVDNDFGILGIAPNVEALAFSEYPLGQQYNRPRAVAAAVAASREGDVVLLEMQSTCCGRREYSPAETDPSVWAITRAAVDAGVVVVAAAGNGNENLDSEAYAAYAARGDSGAILVGAGEARIGHTKASFSTAWGDWSVMTAGYGVCDFDGASEEERWYTNQFSGTSSASALVAGAVSALQSWALNNEYSVPPANNSGRFVSRRNAPLAPNEIRDVVAHTGVAQEVQDEQQNGAIGPHINLRSAIEFLMGKGEVHSADWAH